MSYVRVVFDVYIDEDESPVPPEELAKKLSLPKHAKMVSSYIESVVIPEINTGVKAKTVGSESHVHEEADRGCLKAYESRGGKLGTYPEYQ